MEDPIRTLSHDHGLPADDLTFRSLYEHAMIGMYRTLPDGHILMANPAAVRMLGYGSLEALAQHNLQECFANAAARGAYRAQIEGAGAVSGLETTWLRLDRNSIGVRVSAQAVRDAQGSIHYIDGTFEDISGQQSIQQELHLTQFCVDHASVGIIRIGADARILSANNEICRLLGYTAAELCTMQVMDIDPNVSFEQWASERENLRASGSKIFESTQRRKDGTLFPVEVANTYLEFEGTGFPISVYSRYLQPQAGRSESYAS